MFQRDGGQPPSKILISSVSEDRSIMSPLFRPSGACHWSSEDFLSDSPHVEDFSCNVVKESGDTDSDVKISSSSNYLQLSHTHSSPCSSVPEPVNTESVIGDSAISSPNLWMENKYRIMPEKICKNLSNSSLCDSGKACLVFHANSVEIMTFDEGFVPSMQDSAASEPMTNSYIDERICSMSSLERTQARTQWNHDKKTFDVVRMKGADLENKKQDVALKEMHQQCEDQIRKKSASNQMGPSLLLKSEKYHQKVPTEKMPSIGLCDTEALSYCGAEDLFESEKTGHSCVTSDTESLPKDHLGRLTKQTNCEKNEGEKASHSPPISNREVPVPGHGEKLFKQNSVNDTFDSETSRHPQLRPNTDVPPLDDSEEPVKLIIVEERHPECLTKDADLSWNVQDNKGENIDLTETQYEGNYSEEMKKEPEYQKTDSPSEEIKGEERNETIPETQDKASEESERVNTGHKQSFSTDICVALPFTYPTKRDGAPETSLDLCRNRNTPLITFCYEPEEHNKEERYNTKRPDVGDDENEVHSFIQKRRSKRTDSINSSQNPDVSRCVASNNDCTEIPENVQPASLEQRKGREGGLFSDADENDMSRSSNINTCVPDTRGNMKRSEEDLTDELEIHLIFSNNETSAIQQIQLKTSDPITSKHNGNVSKDMDLFNTDLGQNFPTDDLVGKPVELMDLFYPDKEVLLFTEPPETEMQCWPPVVSVSALQPAPASETVQEEEPVSLVEDLVNGIDSIEGNDKVNLNYSSKPLIP